MKMHAATPSRQVFIEHPMLAFYSMDGKEPAWKDALLAAFKNRNKKSVELHFKDERTALYEDVLQEAVEGCDGIDFSMSANNFQKNVGHHSSFVQTCAGLGIIKKVARSGMK
jgi:L-ribulose-5-phosphate 3-epimerase UlaE